MKKASTSRLQETSKESHDLMNPVSSENHNTLRSIGTSQDMDNISLFSSDSDDSGSRSSNFVTPPLLSQASNEPVSAQPSQTPALSIVRSLSPTRFIRSLSPARIVRTLSPTRFFSRATGQAHKADEADYSHNDDLPKRGRGQTKLSSKIKVDDSIQNTNSVSSMKNYTSDCSPVILLLGGVSLQDPLHRHLSSYVSCYHVRTDSWNFFEMMPEPRHHHAACLLGDKVYVTGGINPLKKQDGKALATDTAFQLDLATRQWQQCASMWESRSHHSMAALNGLLYVFGGKNSLGRLTSNVEIYKPKKNLWYNMCKMPVPVMGSGIASLNNRIWVLGGIKKISLAVTLECFLSQVLSYEPETERWRWHSKLPIPVAFTAAATTEDKIWLCGGATVNPNEPDSQLQSIDAIQEYDPPKDKWKLGITLSSPRHDCAAVRLGDQMFVLGGQSSLKESLTQTCIIDIKHRKLDVGMPLPHPVTAPAAVAYEFDVQREKIEIIKTHSTADPSSATNPVARTDGKDNAVANNHVSFVPNENRTQEMAERKALPENQRKKAKKKKTPPRSPSPKDKDKMKGKPRSTEALDRSHKCQHSHSPVTVCKSDGDQTNLMSDKGVHSLQSVQWRESPQPFATMDEMHLLPTTDVANGTNETRAFPSRESERRNSAFTTVKKVEKISNVTDYDDSTFEVWRADSDPNLGMALVVPKLSNKEREKEWSLLPSFASSIGQSSNVQEPAFPSILLLGGMFPREAHSIPLGRAIIKFHPLKEKWQFIGMMPQPRNYHAVVLYDDNIYVTGGFDPSTLRNMEQIATGTTLCYNLNDKRWTLKSAMNQPRACHGMVQLGRKLFVVGGRDHKGRLLSSVEEYDPTSDVWRNVANLPQKCMGSAVVAYHNKLWSIGGITKVAGESKILDSVYCYAPETNKWFKHAALLEIPKAFCSAAVINHLIWVSGGCTNGVKMPLESLSAISVLKKPEQNYPVWERHAMMSVSRHATATATIGQFLYIIGGMSTKAVGPSAENECYFTYEAQKYKLPSLPVPLAGAAAVVVPPKLESAYTVKNVEALIKRACESNLT